jgi:hypothetical protein
MKLPRWLVVSMLAASSLAILALVGWWWVTWPERTLQVFKSLIADGRFEDADRMLIPPAKIVVEEPDCVMLYEIDETYHSRRLGSTPDAWQQRFRLGRVEHKKRSWSELFERTCTFRIKRADEYDYLIEKWEFTVKRDRIAVQEAKFGYSEEQ